MENVILAKPASNSLNIKVFIGVTSCLLLLNTVRFYLFVLELHIFFKKIRLWFSKKHIALVSITIKLFHVKLYTHRHGQSVSPVAQSCPTLWDPMNCNPPGLPVHHKPPESTQTHAHRVGDAIQPSHPLSSPSPPAPNPSQHQGLFQWVNSSHEVAKVLQFQLQYQSFQWTPGTYLLQDGLVRSPCSPRGSQESSPTPQFQSINSLVLSFLYSPTLTSMHDHWKKP